MEYKMSDRDKRWCDDYLKAHYVGCVKDTFENGCYLYFKDINNFVQNAGRFSDLEIYNVDADGNYEVLFDTKGTFINRIWPELSLDYRSSVNVQADINYIAGRINKLMNEEGEYVKPLPRVEKFIKNNHGEEALQRNRELLESVNNGQNVESMETIEGDEITNTMMMEMG